MSKSKSLSLGFNAKITPIEKLNNQFVVAKCYIHGLGKNRNLSNFSKENVLRNLNTIFNIPVIGHIIECEDGTRYMGSHDVEMQLTEDGISFKNLTVPFGVVPMQGEDTLYFEDVVEPSGKTVTYLVGKVLLWVKRYPELLDCIYSDDFYFNESMEIDWESAKTLEDDDNYLDIVDYTYSALCLLGKSSDPEKHSEPCFPCSRVEPYMFALNKTEFSEMMSELKTELAFYFENTTKKEGGKGEMNTEKINEILLEYNIKLEDLDFEIDENMSEEDFKLKLDTFKKRRKKCSEAEKYASTYRQKREALENACDPVVVKDDDGNVVSQTYYWVQDFDDSFVFVEKSFWSDDNNENSVGRFSYEFNEDTVTASLTSEFEKMFVTWLTAEEKDKLEASRKSFEDLQGEFDTYKESHTVENSEVEQLKEFKASRLSEDHKFAIAEKLAEFEDLAENAEFIALKENAESFENVEDLERECYVIRGKNVPVKFSAKPNKTTSIKLPIGSHQIDDEPYGGLFSFVKKND